MALLIPFILCRLFQSRKDWKGALFGFCQDLFVSSEIVLLFPNPIFWFLLTTYQLAGWYLSFFLKIPLTMGLWKFALRPASFADSIREFFPIIIGGLLLAGISLLGFIGEFDRLVWVGILIASGAIALCGEGNNPLFLMQKNWLSRKKKGDGTKWEFPHEIAAIVNPEFPLFRKSIFLGKKRFEAPLKNKPHVVFLILESFRAKNVGCVGASVPLSPNFDRIAKKGIIFTQFHSNSNLTSCCSIASLFGIPPAPVHGHLGEYGKISLHGLPKILKKEGYHTALLQGGHIAFDHGPEFFQAQGFQTLIGKRDIEKEMGNVSSSSWGVHDEHLMRYASNWLKKQTDPTFLTLFTITIHHPWTAPGSLGGFLESFSYTDRSLGLFLEEMPENCLLFIFGDHGQESRSEHFEINKNLYQENLHVPLLIYAPGIEPKRIDTPCSQIDLLPTLLDLLHLTGPHHSLGRSLVRELPPAPLFFSHPFDGKIRAIRKENWKLILDGNSAELYDLSKDPDERNHLANPVEELKQEVDAYQAKVRQLYEKNQFAPEEICEGSSLCLEVANSLEFDDKALAKIDPNLSSLSIAHCLLLTDEGFSNLFTRHTGLEKLVIQGLDITSSNWPILPYLMHVKAADCAYLNGKWLSKLSSLRILQLSATDFSDDDIGQIGGLWALQLSHMDQITDKGLTPLFNKNHHLTTVSLEHCSQIGDETLQSLQGRVLCQLSLVSLPQITDEGIRFLANLPLQHLIIQNCPKITGATLHDLQSKGIHILLAQCPQIDSIFINPLIEKGMKIWWDAIQ